MRPLIRVSLAAAAALPVAADAQAIRPVTTPPPTVAVHFPTVTVTVQYPPPLSSTTSLPPPTQTPTIVLSVPASTAASPNAERAVATSADPVSPESNRSSNAGRARCLQVVPRKLKARGPTAMVGSVTTNRGTRPAIQIPARTMLRPRSEPIRRARWLSTGGGSRFCSPAPPWSSSGSEACSVDSLGALRGQRSKGTHRCVSRCDGVCPHAAEHR